MNRLVITSLNVGFAATLAISLVACNRDATADGATGVAAMSEVAAPQATTPAVDAPKFARVVSVDPIRETVNNPKRVCRDEVVTHTAPPRDQHQIAGTAIGAVAGGLLGNQIGGGKGNTLATVAGAVGGGYAGKRIQESRQQGQVTQTTEQRCTTVNNATQKIIAYDVRYEYNGVTRSVRMDHDPGDRLEVQEGVTAVTDAR